MKFLTLLFLAGCSAQPVNFALEGRTHCFGKLRNAKSAEDFVRLAGAEEAEAAFFGEAAEGRRRLLCAVSAYEAADAVVANNEQVRSRLQRLYVILKSHH